MVGNRRSLQEKYTQLRIKMRALEQQRDAISETEDTTTYFDLCVAIKNTRTEIQAVASAL